MRRLLFALFAGAVALIVAGSGRPAAATAPGASRFFFAGDGRLALHHGHFDTTLAVRYRGADGRYDKTALAEIRRFFRSRQDGREGDISLRLVELLGFIQTRFRPQRLTLLSAYRSPEFNDNIRAGGGKAAKSSLHSEGLAADITLAGVDLRQLWKDLRELRTGGVGYYRSSNFLHVDTGRPRFWEETTSRVDENLSAGNARVFLRTDFDRYPDINGAVLSLHSVSAFPLAVAAEASFVGADGTASTARLASVRGVQLDGAGCLQIPAFSDAYQLQIVDAPRPAGSGPWRVVLSTCAPRIERTPESVESNPIELMAR